MYIVVKTASPTLVRRLSLHPSHAVIQTGGASDLEQSACCGPAPLPSRADRRVSLSLCRDGANLCMTAPLVEGPDDPIGDGALQEGILS